MLFATRSAPLGYCNRVQGPDQTAGGVDDLLTAVLIRFGECWCAQACVGAVQRPADHLGDDRANLPLGFGGERAHAASFARSGHCGDVHDRTRWSSDRISQFAQMATTGLGPAAISSSASRPKAKRLDASNTSR